MDSLCHFDLVCSFSMYLPLHCLHSDTFPADPLRCTAAVKPGRSPFIPDLSSVSQGIDFSSGLLKQQNRVLRVRSDNQYQLQLPPLLRSPSVLPLGYTTPIPKELGRCVKCNRNRIEKPYEMSQRTWDGAMFTTV